MRVIDFRTARRSAADASTPTCASGINLDELRSGGGRSARRRNQDSAAASEQSSLRT
jgi:hypothetical protein